LLLLLLLSFPPQGKPENMKAAQEALLKRAKANSDAQLGQYDPSNESADADQRTYEKGYKVRTAAAAASSLCFYSFSMLSSLCLPHSMFTGQGVDSQCSSATASACPVNVDQHSRHLQQHQHLAVMPMLV
jgi:hypothetical protein